MAVADIWNAGLTLLGVNTVGFTTDTTSQAQLLNKIWPDFRKQFLADNSWNGAKTTASLSLLADSDFAGKDRWPYVFSLPSDYLRVLSVNGYGNQPSSANDSAWEIEVVADTSGNRTRCLLTNQSTVKLEYVFDVLDDVDLLGSAVRHAMGLALAAYAAANFGKSPEEIGIIESKAREAMLKARGIDGQESSPRFFSSTSLIDARWTDHY